MAMQGKTLRKGRFKMRMRKCHVKCQQLMEKGWMMMQQADKEHKE